VDLGDWLKVPWLRAHDIVKAFGFFAHGLLIVNNESYPGPSQFRPTAPHNWDWYAIESKALHAEKMLDGPPEPG
jgi:hypothetical protein